MYIFIYIVTIFLCASLGAYLAGNSGIFYGAGVGFILSPGAGLYYQIRANRRQVRRQALEYMKAHNDRIEKAFPDDGSLKRMRLIEHTMLSISAIINRISKEKNEPVLVNSDLVFDAVDEYAGKCGDEEDSGDLEELIIHIHKWLIENSQKE